MASRLPRTVRVANILLPGMLSRRVVIVCAGKAVEYELSR